MYTQALNGDNLQIHDLSASTPVKQNPLSDSNSSRIPNLAAITTPEQIEQAFSAFGDIIRA
jgi:hypothetical protein